jgi:hypothetical protein
MSMKKLYTAAALLSLGAWQGENDNPTFNGLKRWGKSKQSRRNKKALHKTKRGGHTYIFG